MTYTQGAVLGLVQGLTEFLPVSSSGHLILAPRVLGWPDQGLAVDAVMHLGTLAALLAYFRRELVAMWRGTLSRRIGVMLVVATIPAALAGVGLKDVIEQHFRSPLSVAGALALWALVMGLADRRAPAAVATGEPLERIGWAAGITVGVAQALALVPGTSRSGITITAGLLAGLDRATAARFSFLLGIVVTAGAGGRELSGLLAIGIGSGQAGPLAAARVAAFVAGWVAVWFLVGYLRRRSLLPFVVYRLALAAAIVAVYW